MRRVLAVLAGAGIAVGGGAAAWAQTAAPDGTKREAARACLSQAREATPDADKAALREAVKACLAEAGIEGRTLTAEQQARRDAVKACINQAREANPDDKAAARAAARECLAEVRAANPDAGKAELRTLVKECVAAR
jgi:ribosomal protein S20